MHTSCVEGRVGGPVPRGDLLVTRNKHRMLGHEYAAGFCIMWGKPRFTALFKHKNFKPKMFKVKTHNIKEFPFESYCEAKTTAELVEIAQTHRLSNHNAWMLPQIAAYYGSWEPVTNSGKICPRLTARQNMTTHWSIGLWRVVTQLKRSSLVATQNLAHSVNYSSVVPIILMGLKRYKNTPYTSWQLDHKDTIVESKLLEAMLWRNDEVYHLPRAELLKIRELGLTVKTGDRTGTQNRATNQWCLRGVGLTGLGSTPQLVQTMLTQIWVCHPSLRTNLMILDPYNWDSTPEPLIQAEVLDAAAPKTNTVQYSNALPWEV